MKFYSKYLRFSLFILGFVFFVISGCKKSEDDSKDGGITPMYGVQEKNYQQKESKQEIKIEKTEKIDKSKT